MNDRNASIPCLRLCWRRRRARIALAAVVVAPARPSHPLSAEPASTRLPARRDSRDGLGSPAGDPAGTPFTTAPARRPRRHSPQTRDSTSRTVRNVAADDYGDPRSYVVAERATVSNLPGQWQLQAQVLHWRGDALARWSTGAGDLRRRGLPRCGPARSPTQPSALAGRRRTQPVRRRRQRAGDPCTSTCSPTR